MPKKPSKSAPKPPPAKAPKGRSKPAQGNALGNPPPNAASPEGAAQPAFELILPSAPEQKLENVAKEFQQVEGHLHERAAEIVYVAAWAGALLLKLKGLHCQQGTRTDLVDTVSTSESEEGFLAYLRENHCPNLPESEADQERYYQSRLRHFRRLMNVARHATLTGDSTLEDLQHVRKLGILEGKSLTDLYKPVKQLEDKAPEPPPERNLAAEASLDLGRICGEIVTLRDQTDHDLYEANWHLLQATLEKYTGCKWSPVPDDYDSAEHGEVTFTAAPKKKKKTSRKAAKGKGNK